MQSSKPRISWMSRAFQKPNLLPGSIGLLGVLVALGVVGCSQNSGPEKVVVSGTVKFDGELIPNGEILFYPIDGTQGSVSGGPIKAGQYTAKGRGGVVVGRHRVEIRAFRASGRKMSAAEAVEGGPAEQYLPLQYNSYSELTCAVDADNTTQDFDLAVK
jgi:hypothetical protein